VERLGSVSESGQTVRYQWPPWITQAGLREWIAALIRQHPVHARSPYPQPLGNLRGS
jgi:hypothetical protein